jgi:hypothetical protein
MTRRAEVLNEIVAEVRRLRVGGARASAIARELTNRGLMGTEIKAHFDAAFGIDVVNPLYWPCDADGQFIAAKLDKLIEPLIDSAGDAWTLAPAYPDLLRRRDRHAFRGLARETGNIFVVRAAEPRAAQYVGRAGFRPFPIHLLDVTRLEAPNEGLVAADPGSEELAATLAALRPPLSFEGYRDRLAAEGLSIADAAEGFVIRDRSGTRFYSGYQLLGVYRNQSGSSAWSGREGERLRWALNRRMGEDLVQFGPHDDWDGRRALEPGNRLRGPLAPALFFTPDGNVNVRFDAESIASYYRFLGIDWDSLYPPDPIPAPEREEI